MARGIIVYGVLIVNALGSASRGSDGVNLAAMQGWDIVVACDAIAAEQYAAQEFQRLLAEATGVEMPIVITTDRPDRHVFIGQSEPMRASHVGFDIQGFGDEDLRIVIRDANIAIAGGRPRGTLYGVYTFLEDYVGVRFLTYDHTFVPKVGPWRVVGPVDRFYHPPLGFRWSFCSETNDNKPFSVRGRNNTVADEAALGGRTAIGLINHTFYRYLPVEAFGQEHPEYFALVNGQRKFHSGDNPPQPCLTNPDVLRIVTEAVLAELRERPEARNVSVSQNDAFPEHQSWCHCEQCAAIDEREGSHMGSLLTLVNAVADEVAKVRPDVLVGTLAYQHTRKPPRHLKPRPNVQIQLCSIECSILHTIDDPAADKNAAFYRDLLEWGRICDNIFIWNYNTNFGNYQLPCPNLRIIEPNIRCFVANHARGIFMQGAYTSLASELSDLRNYMTANLLWDPNRSGAALMDEFLGLHYGRSAPPIRRFIDLVHDHAQASGLQTGCGGQAKDFAIDESIVQAGLAAFEEALALADNDTIRRRVEKASICAYRAAIEPVWKVSGENPVGDEVAQQAKPLVARWINLCRRYGVTQVYETKPFEDVARRISKGIGLPYTPPEP